MSMYSFQHHYLTSVYTKNNFEQKAFNVGNITTICVAHIAAHTGICVESAFEGRKGWMDGRKEG